MPEKGVGLRVAQTCTWLTDICKRRKEEFRKYCQERNRKVSAAFEGGVTVANFVHDGFVLSGIAVPLLGFG